MLRLLFLSFCFAPATFSAEKTTENSIIEEMEQAFEQTTTGEDAPQGDVIKIKVTGSRIKRIDLISPNPMTIITKEDIQNSGYLSLSELLRNSSLSNFGGVQIHNRSTLTLVNGARLLYDNSVDLIPTAAIERVEILKDGASALYGSDVVGGVINIITKRDFSSPELSLRLSPSLYHFYKGGSELDTSVVFGKKFNRGHFISSLQWQYIDSIKASQRKQWYDEIFIQRFSPYASFQIGKQFLVDPDCPEKLKEDRRCKYDIVPHSYIRGNVTESSSYNYLEYELFDEIRFYTQWVGIWNRSSQPDQLIFGNLELPAEHQMSQGSGQAGVLQHLFGNSYEDLYTSDQYSNFIYLDKQVGLKGYIFKTWDWDWNLKWSNSWTRDVYEDYFYKEDLIKSFTSGAYDPYNPNKRDLSSVRRHNAVYKDHDLRFFSSLDFSGETGIWDIDLAVGAQAYYNRYKNTADPEAKKGNIFALAPNESGTLKRHVIASYIEGVKNFSEALEVQLAGRIDRYSDFGWTINPKLAFLFKPNSQFLFRSSVGTSFEAPELEQLNIPTSESYIPVYDTVACYNELKDKEQEHFKEIYNSLGDKTQEAKDELVKDFLIEQRNIIDNPELSGTVKTAFKNLADQMGNRTYCRINYFKGISKGNKEVKETKIRTASVGFHWQVVEDHSLTADYWWNSLSSTLIEGLNRVAMGAELKHGKKYVEKYGLQYERDETHPYKPIKNPVQKDINVPGKKLSGLDLTWESDFPQWTVQGGNFYFKNDFAYVIKAGVELFPGMGFVNNLGKSSLPKWRNFSTFGWKSSKNNVYLKLKSVAGVKKLNNEFDTLPMGHIVDLFYQYRYDTKTSFKFGWYNLLFSEPVIDDSRKQGAKFNSRFFDVKGPSFFAELRRTL